MRVKTNAVLSERERALRKATLGMDRATVREFHRVRKLTRAQRERRKRRNQMLAGSNIRDLLMALVEGRCAERVA